jgi:hypothetical protein
MVKVEVIIPTRMPHSDGFIEFRDRHLDIIELEALPRTGEFVFFAENENEDPTCHVVKFVYHQFFPVQPPQIVMVSLDDEHDYDHK